MLERFRRSRLALLLLCLSTPAFAADVLQQGANATPNSGFANWDERVIHEWINRARVDPATELAGCGTNCSVLELQPSCYAPMAPLMWRYELNVSARFHSDEMLQQGWFSHDTPCALRMDLSSVYPGSCNGSAACSCSGSGTTPFNTRISRFGASGSGEIIAAGYGDPVSVFYGWLWEPTPASTACQFTSSNGHRYLILTASNSVGAGVSGARYTADFGGGGTVSPLPSGAHYPRQADSIDFWANWYSDRPPNAARVVIDGTTAVMTRARGTSTNGAWTTKVAGLGTGCHRYYFEFTDATGQPVKNPSSGTYGIGPADTCADWQDTAVTGPPPVLTATTAATTSVQLGWTASTGATQYEVQRAVGNLSFAPLVTVGTTSWSDNTAVAGQTYLYRVRGVGGTTWSNVDYASTVAFTDDQLVAGATPVKAMHLVELRAAANAIRTAVGLLARTWTNPSPAVIRAVDFADVRSAINEARVQIGAAPLTFTDPTLGTSVTVRAVHVNELRAAMR